MKHIWSKLCVGTLAAAMTFGISACSLGGVSTADATVYVRGLINLTFLGQFDEDYLKLVDSDETESQEIYDSNLDVDVDNFASYYAIDTVSDDLRTQIRQLYQDMYAKAKFEVKEAVKQDSTTYSVEVIIEPLDIYQRVDSVLEDTMNAFSDQYFAEHPEVLESTGMPGDPAYDAYDAAYGQAIVDLFQEKLPEAGYFDAQSVVVQLKLNEDTDTWEMPDNQFQSLDEYFNYINYPTE